MSDTEYEKSLNIPGVYRCREVFLNQNYPLAAMLVPHPCGNLPEHQHEFIELVLVFRGRGSHRSRDTEGNVKDFSISAGDVFVVDQGVRHFYYNCEKLWVYNLLFKPEFIAGERAYLAKMPSLNRLLFTSGLPSEPLHLSGKTLYHVNEQLNRLIKEISEHPEGFELVSKVAFLEVLQFLGRKSTKIADSTNSRHHQAVHRAFDYMEAHYDKPLTLDMLAREACMSQAHFSRKFKAITAFTPWECLIQFRVEKAKELLLSTDMALDEIALKTGLCDSSYLIKTFKRNEHITPSQFRRRWCDT